MSNWTGSRITIPRSAAPLPADRFFTGLCTITHSTKLQCHPGIIRSLREGWSSSSFPSVWEAVYYFQSPVALPHRLGISDECAPPLRFPLSNSFHRPNRPCPSLHPALIFCAFRVSSIGHCSRNLSVFSLDHQHHLDRCVVCAVLVSVS